jgi:hypothetical protein
MQGWRRFLTLGGHWRSFSLTSLGYFCCSSPLLENKIGSEAAIRFGLAHRSILRATIREIFVDDRRKGGPSAF